MPLSGGMDPTMKHPSVKFVILTDEALIGHKLWRFRGEFKFEFIEITKNLHLILPCEGFIKTVPGG